MNRLALLASVLLITACHSAAHRLSTADPESQGVSSKSILDFVQAAEKEVDAMHSFVLLRHGKVIAEGWWDPYNRQSPHMLYSLSKSFTSTAIGFAVAEGKLRVDDKVLSFFPDDAPPNPSDNLKAMRIRDLLTMSTGHAKDTLPSLTTGSDPNWPKVFLSLPVEHKPGTHFLYNTGATYMLSAILTKVTGQPVLDYLRPRLFEPLGIEHPTWETDPRGVSVGGWGLKVTTTDIAKFGQLYLQKGMWNGKQLLPESWVADATSAQVSNSAGPGGDWSQGYGYQFWRSRHNCFRGDGAMGQYCIVMPEHDAVLAITSGTTDMQRVLNIVWDHLLPAFNPSPLPTDAQARAALDSKLRTLSHAPVTGATQSPIATAIAGKKFVVDKNGIQSITLDPAGDQTRLTIHTPTGDQIFQLPAGRWQKQSVYFEKLGVSAAATSASQPVAASGAWAAPDRYVMRAWLYETPYRLEMEFTFDPDHKKVTVKRKLYPIQTTWVTAEGTAP